MDDLFRARFDAADCREQTRPRADEVQDVQGYENGHMSLVADGFRGLFFAVPKPVLLS